MPGSRIPTSMDPCGYIYWGVRVMPCARLDPPDIATLMRPVSVKRASLP